MRLKSLFQRQTISPPLIGLPEHTRVYAIGDIHGRLDLLKIVHEKILQHAQGYTGDITVVYLGDYIDRGPHSMQVVDYLLSEPLPDFKSVYLLGNHEDMLLEFIESSHWAVGKNWLNYGGLLTLLSYGVSIEGIHNFNELSKIRTKFLNNCPISHRQFFRSLQLSFELGGYFFVHAGIKPKLPLNKQKNDDLLWIRYDFLNSSKQFEKVIVHGHSVTEVPELKSNRIGLDTGACFSGCLSCAVFEGKGVDFISSIA